eukprot:SAG31_NODE_521_length_14624_cov_34.536867_1_plen_100_part_00
MQRNANIQAPAFRVRTYGRTGTAILNLVRVRPLIQPYLQVLNLIIDLVLNFQYSCLSADTVYLLVAKFRYLLPVLRRQCFFFKNKCDTTHEHATKFSTI